MSKKTTQNIVPAIAPTTETTQETTQVSTQVSTNATATTPTTAKSKVNSMKKTTETTAKVATDSTQATTETTASVSTAIDPTTPTTTVESEATTQTTQSAHTQHSESTQSTAKKVVLNDQIINALAKVLAIPPTIATTQAKKSTDQLSHEISKILDIDQSDFETILSINLFRGKVYRGKEVVKAIRQFAKNTVFTKLNAEKNEVDYYSEFAKAFNSYFQAMDEETTQLNRIHSVVKQPKKLKNVDVALITPDRIAINSDNSDEFINLKSCLVDKWQHSKDDPKASIYQQPEVSLAVRLLLQINSVVYGEKYFNIGDSTAYQHISTTPKNFKSILEKCGLEIGYYSEKTTKEEIILDYLKKHCCYDEDDTELKELSIKPEHKYAIECISKIQPKHYPLIIQIDEGIHDYFIDFCDCTDTILDLINTRSEMKLDAVEELKNEPSLTQEQYDQQIKDKEAFNKQIGSVLNDNN